MSKKVAVPLMLLSLGIFAVTQTAGCGSSSNGGGTGGAKADGGTGGRGTGGTTADAGTGGRGTGGTTADAGTGGRGTGGTTADAGTGGMGTGGRIDAGGDVVGTGGMGTGGNADAGTGGRGTGGSTDAATDTPADMATPTDTASDAPGDGPLAFAAATCSMPAFMGNGNMTALSAADFCTIYLAVCNKGDRDAATVTRATCEARYGASSTADGGGTYGSNGACKSVHVCNAYNIPGSFDLHCGHAEGNAPCAP